jgi:tetratricopeptide (TPR) repeat protein
VGRQDELNALTDWITKPPTTHDARIFCFVAIGGMGKSALTWKWFNQISPNEMKPLAGRLWWSFYESDATFENFLIRALCYVGGEPEEAVRKRPWQDREALLLKKLNDKPYLFVLDGLERILIAYNRMDASSLADDDYDKACANYVTGAAGLPPTAAQSFVGQHQLRQATDPRAGAFLQKLAQVTKSRILITTRLYPTELQASTGYPRPGCFAYFLTGLSDDDAIGLWRALGVTGSRGELMPIFRSIENHPLLVQALASVVANYKKAPGDFAKWRDAHPQFDPASLPLVKSRTHILEFALNGLSDETRDVLSMIVGFRMPASYAALEALLVGDGKACASAQHLDRVLTELEDRGLIGWDRAANRYDAHPIVRGVVWQLTEARDQQAVYKALDAHFEPMATPEWQEVESLADLTPAIERYNTLVGLRRYDNAFTLFRDRLEYATLYRLAAHRERIALLEQVFPDGTTELPALMREADQAWALNGLALSYQHSGQPGQAAPLFRRDDEICERQHDDNNRRAALTNLGSALRESGALRETIWTCRTALILGQKLKDEIAEADSLQNLGRTLAAAGDDASARVALSRSRKIVIERKHSQGDGLAYSYLAEYALWFGDLAKAETWADRAWELAADQRHERDFIRAALLQGRAALGNSDLTHADERLHHALTRARAVNMVELELLALIALAELALKLGNPAQARARLDDVWEAAERGPYPLYKADAFNVLADIALAEGNKPAAIDAATKAYHAAWCDGPPYAYHWGLVKAKAHLKALGAPEPKLPPFDESKFEPLPKVEINPKDKFWVDPDKLDD